MDSRRVADLRLRPGANQLNDAEIGGNTSYIYNGDGVRTARETSSTYIEYVIDHNRSLPVILYDETAFYVWGLDLIARIVGSTQQYYHYDGLGSTRALTNGSGTTTATYNYDAFGSIKSQTGSGTNNFLFTGEWRDPETGFYFLRARYYDPVVGRFINRDPVAGFTEAPQTLNAYVYVGNNATTLVDPSGLLSAPPLLLEKEQYRYYARLGLLETLQRLCRGLIEACFGGGKGPTNPGIGGRVPTGAYDIAKAGGKHAGTLRNYSNRPAEQIQRAQASHEEQVSLHREKIANPAGHAENWESLSPRAQAGFIREMGERS